MERGIEVRPEPSVPPRPQPAGSWLPRTIAFIAVGIVLYLVAYGASEALVYSYGERNRFYMIATADREVYDYVFLGASRAMTLGYEDMNQRLEALTGTTVMNLSTEGGGVLPNRLILDYFLRRRHAHRVVYFADCFAFYAADWNEERLDAGMLQRAPLDSALAMTLWEHPWARPLLPGYLSGIAKINNQDRFAPDRTEAEMSRFGRVHFSNVNLDAQRMRFLYPAGTDEANLDKYLREFGQFIRMLDDQDIELLVVRLPVPERVHELAPEEDMCSPALIDLLDGHGIPYYDFSHVSNDDAYFYDTDHMNRDGVLAFTEAYLADVLVRHTGRD